MVDLVWMMNKLVDEEGNILVEGIMDSVAPVTPEEEAKYHNIGRKTLSLSLLLSRG
jgi:nonspecific dipeptidase